MKRQKDKMLKYYLMLQLRRLHRMVVGMGGYPILNYLLGITVFLLISFAMYFNLKYFSYVYIFVALWAVSLRDNPQYIDFLKQTFTRKDFIRIRIVENCLIAFPFIHFLCFSGKIAAGVILLILSVMMTGFSPRIRWRYTIPTPFFRYPFEFIRGFRVTFILIVSAYFITYLTLPYANVGIGIFSIIMVSLVCTSFYMKVEEEFYVWIFSANARQFIHDKLRIAAFSTLFLCLPILTALMVSNPEKVLVVIAVQLAGLCYVCAGVLCKYATFPGDIQAKEGLLLFPFSVICPPLLIYTIPYLYKKSIRSLEGILK